MIRYIKWLTALVLAVTILSTIVPFVAFAEELAGENSQHAVQMRMEKDSTELAAPMTDLGFEGIAFLVSLCMASILQFVRLKWGAFWEFPDEK